MTYIAFLAATLLYFSVGPGGPLHNDRWFHALRGRVDALEPDFWMGFVLLVVVPCAAFALVYGLLQEMFGEAAVLLLGRRRFFSAWDDRTGRHYSTVLKRGPSPGIWRVLC